MCRHFVKFEALEVFQARCFKDVKRVFQGSFKDVSKVLQESFKGVSRKL